MHDEGRPEVMLEAMAAGLPVIASDLRAHRDFVRHRETGWLVQERIQAKYWWREPDWCLRRLLRLLLGQILPATLEKQRVAKIRAFAAGVSDGFRHRMGACEREWLYRQ